MTARTEHAETLLGNIRSPVSQPDIILNKVAFDSAAYSNFHELVQLLKREITPLTTGSQERIEAVKAILRKIRINEKEWQPYTSFKEHKYTRNLVGYDEQFTVLLLCWNKKQASPIHDHAGSNCWVKCLHGTLTETLYRHKSDEDKELYVVRTADANPNDVCYIDDSYGYHRMSNDSETDVCVTLHIYSPPYQFCNAFNLDGSKRQVCMLAANAPYGTFFDGEDRCASGSEEDLQSIGTKLQAIGACPEDNEASATRWQAKVYELLESTKVSQRDWEKYTHFSDQRYTRSMVFSNELFSVLLLCWMPGQGTPKHIHGTGTHSWFRMLAGSLDLNFFDDRGVKTRALNFTRESAPFFEGEGRTLHEVVNSSSDIAVSLHIYSPPYKHLSYDDPVGHGCRTLPVIHCEKDVKAEATSVAPLVVAPVSTEMVFTNFSALGELLTREFDTVRLDAERCGTVTALLERCTFHDEEIKNFNTLRNSVGNQLLLHRSEKFTVELVFWKREHATQIHDHGNSASWIKVLRGRLSEVVYRKCSACEGCPLEIAHSALLLPDALSFLGKGVQHLLRSGASECVTLHVTSPPGDCSNQYSLSGKSVKQMFVFADSAPEKLTL